MTKVALYCRVSTEDQIAENQMIRLRKIWEWREEARRRRFQEELDAIARRDDDDWYDEDY